MEAAFWLAVIASVLSATAAWYYGRTCQQAIDQRDAALKLAAALERTCLKAVHEAVMLRSYLESQGMHPPKPRPELRH